MPKVKVGFGISAKITIALSSESLVQGETEISKIWVSFCSEVKEISDRQETGPTLVISEFKGGTVCDLMT